MSAPVDGYLTRAQAAALLTSWGYPVAVQTLANKAANDNAGNGPPYTTTGWRTIYYTEKDLRAWFEKQRRRVG